MRRWLWILVLVVGCSANAPSGPRGAVLESPAQLGHVLALQLGKVRYQRFEYPEALDLFRRALALAPGDMEALHFKEMARILCGVGTPAAFRPKTLPQIEQELRERFDVGRRLEAAGQPHRAAALYRHVLEGIRWFPTDIRTGLKQEVQAQPAHVIERWSAPVEAELHELWDLVD